MSHLAVIRRGWQNEHLAAFLLSKFSFLSHPVKIGDDLGCDLFCTFFDIESKGKKEYLVPESSFAIQIKSKSKNKILDMKQIEYLEHLKLPFFIGVIDQNELSLTIYSGEYLPILFSLKGIPVSLKLELQSEHHITPDRYFEEVGNRAYRLKCPYVFTISESIHEDDLKKEMCNFRQVVERVQRNIVSRSSGDHIFHISDRPDHIEIAYGPASAEVFRDNFKRRLAAVFLNLAWIAENRPKSLDTDELRLYIMIYDEIHKREQNLPRYLTDSAEESRKRLREMDTSKSGTFTVPPTSSYFRYPRP
jgi:hypothetical protein